MAHNNLSMYLEFQNEMSAVSSAVLLKDRVVQIEEIKVLYLLTNTTQNFAYVPTPM